MLQARQQVTIITGNHRVILSLRLTTLLSIVFVAIAVRQDILIVSCTAMQMRFQLIMIMQNERL